MLYRYKTHRMRYLESVDPTGEEVALLGGITDRKLGALRLILSAAALLIIYIDPTEPDRYVQATYSSIVAYTFFSLLVYLAARQRTNFPNHILKLLIWFDIACFTALISMSSGTSSVFYFFYMFEIIVACSRGGRRLGLAVTAASSLLCVAVGLLVRTNEVFELNRFLLRPLAIVALGYTLAYWGATELALRKRLILLKQLSAVANPRFGIDRTIDQMLQRILHFYNADLCVMILDLGAESQLYLAPNRDRIDHSKQQVTEDNTRLFLAQVSDSCPEMFAGPSVLKQRSTYKRYDPRTNKVTNLDPAPADSLSRILGARSLKESTNCAIMCTVSNILQPARRALPIRFAGSPESLKVQPESESRLTAAANRLQPTTG